MPSITKSSSSPAPQVASVLPDSIADALALLPGDRVLAVNGAPVADYIAYRFAIAEEEIALEIARGEERGVFEIEKDADEDLGLVFTGDVFDGVRACRNQCVFCFENQMPVGMRPSLNLRDDDFRLSFLHGNFLTLTNFSDADFDRVIREHLSPLYVSIHATDPAVRRRMLGARRAPDVLTQLRRLGDGGIQLHGQIVLCPGWNDGAMLARTLDDLAALYPTVLTVGVVPVGLTAHRPAGPDVRAVTPDDAATVLDLVTERQQAFLSTLGTRFVFAADEFYLSAGRDLPPLDAYEELAQKENGIGLARLFLEELDGLKLRRRKTPTLAEHVTLATGTLAAPLLARLAVRLRAAGHAVEVVAVPNRFYGGGVSVAGLLTGADLLSALRGRDLGRLVLLPAVTLNSDGVLLDDMTPEALARELGAPVRFCAGPENVVRYLQA